MSLKGLNIASLTRKTPLPAPVTHDPHTAEFERVVQDETHQADALIAATDAILDSTPNETGVVIDDATESNIDDESEKLSRLVDDEFPFDDSQLVALHGLVQQQYACLIGAAGTGKTTVTKKLVDMLRSSTSLIDVSQYWKRGQTEEHDDYEAPERFIPSIVMVSFTGRASQMTKKNFPRDWHGNIMTIHRALGFYPEFYEAYDEESGQMKNKRRFVPSYDENNKMPWDIVIVDEAGMLGLDLWHQLYAACKPGCRIILIGDINQLPPTHGKSILGFALANWPTWELTHIHRQQGANNSIVDNAHRILKGLRPVSDCPATGVSLKNQTEMIAALNYMANDKDWRFITLEVPEDHRQASLRIRQMLKLLQGKLYEPNRDVVITPINGFEQTVPGYALGQQPMNQELVVSLNSESPRYFIDAGRERQNFAVGDKVMATVNDYEAGITNGMTGIITGIVENGGYSGDPNRFGLITEVNEYYAGLKEIHDDDDADFSLESMAEDFSAGMDELKKKEERDAGPASHIVTVRFGEGDASFEIAFDSKSRVASLMLAYVATCHKMQGGECPLVFVIVHQATKRPLNREWFYTGVTRASQRCVVLHTRQGMGFALGKQNIKGTTLEQKVKTFVALTQSGMVGPSVKVKIPERQSLTKEVTQYEPKEVISEEAKQEVANAPAREESRRPEGERIRPEPAQPTVRIGALHIHIHESQQAASQRQPADSHDIDGGSLQVEQPVVPQEPARLTALPAPPKAVSQWGAVHMALKLSNATENAQRLLTHQPKPEPTKPISGKVSLAALLQKQRNPKL